jgi:hypothetical protein
VKLDGDGRDLTESQPLAAASYVTGRSPFHFGQMGVKVGATAGAAAAIGGVRKVTLKIDRKMKTDQFYANGAGLKDQPTTNDKVGLSGTITADYKVAADLADRFRDDTQFALVWEFIGANLNATFFQTLRFTLPACFLDDGTPEVDGPDVVSTDFNFTGFYDLTNAPVTIDYISADTAL